MKRKKPRFRLCSSSAIVKCRVGTLSVRGRSGANLGTMTVAGALDLLRAEVERAGQQLSPYIMKRWPIVPKLRVNREIRVREVRVIGPEGEQLGILPTPDAFKQAQEVGYDLVEVAPTSVPPVCRIMDYGKYKYELSKKDHQSRRHQKSTQVKEIKLRPRTDKHDLEIKIRQIKGFLAEGNKTKVVLTYRGREMANQEMGRTVMNSVIASCRRAGTIEYAPRMEGRSLIMIVAPKN